ncbi:hypothetical protein F4802DRAFT_567598 [Xylaria palmicola]|nr:hypothetical protein F4802DRAFT_567598 [Xylaria palmicola]
MLVGAWLPFVQLSFCLIITIHLVSDGPSRYLFKTRSRRSLHITVFAPSSTPPHPALPVQALLFVACWYSLPLGFRIENGQTSSE